MKKFTLNNFNFFKKETIKENYIEFFLIFIPFLLIAIGAPFFIIFFIDFILFRIIIFFYFGAVILANIYFSICMFFAFLMGLFPDNNSDPNFILISILYFVFLFAAIFLSIFWNNFYFN